MSDEILDAGTPVETPPDGADERGEGADETGDSGEGSTLLTGEDGNGGEDKPDAGGTAPDGKDGEAAPEHWRLELAEKYAADRANADAFAEQCRKLGMTREQAQASLDFSVRMHEAQTAAFIRQRREWRSQIQTDPDFGGKNFSASCTAAKKALSVLDENGDVRRMLEETGYGDNPAVIRVFARIGRAMAEDRFVSGKPAREDLPLEERLYK